MNPLHPEIPRVTWRRLLLAFSIGFLFWLLVHWLSAVGLAALFLVGIAIVVGAGAVLFFGMRAREDK